MLYPVPAPYREPRLDADEARSILRCGPEVFAELVAAGLPATEGPDGLLFDRHDLINLALHAGSGRSMPERALRFALRWMRDDPSSWTKPLAWDFSIELRAEGAAESSSWSHPRFLPELTGGMIETWESSTAVRLTPELFVFGGPGPIGFSGRMRTAGTLQELRSPVLREITEGFLAAGYRWAKLPKTCQYDYEPIMAAGFAPCVAASVYLEKEFRSAGYQTETRGGWILGMLDLSHSWVEVVDDDGRVKQIDPVFERLSRFAADPHPGLARACLGSRLNRLLPAAIPAGEPEAIHTNAGASTPADISIVIRRVGAR
jgi:PAS domain-containing protein